MEIIKISDILYVISPLDFIIYILSSNGREGFWRAGCRGIDREIRDSCWWYIGILCWFWGFFSLYLGKIDIGSRMSLLSAST
jgi:hypothetical protein